MPNNWYQNNSFIYNCTAIAYTRKGCQISPFLGSHVQMTQKYCVVISADFGLSAEEGASECVGTATYAAPEMQQGRKYLTNSDIWSLGIIMYTLLFKKTPQATFRAHPEVRIPPTNTLDEFWRDIFGVILFHIDIENSASYAIFAIITEYMEVRNQSKTNLAELWRISSV